MLQHNVKINDTSCQALRIARFAALACACIVLQELLLLAVDVRCIAAEFRTLRGAAILSGPLEPLWGHSAATEEHFQRPQGVVHLKRCL